LRDRPRRYLLVSVGTIFRTDSFSISPPEEEDAASGTNLQRRCREEEEEGALELRR
jgi:hypothetical protein